MKVLFVSAILSLGFALPPAAFAQNAAANSTNSTNSQAAPTSQMPQQGQTHWSGTQHADESGYGMESSGTSSASTAHMSRYGSLVSHEGRNDLFAHH
ncbi:MAG TPA: hypothetical protein VMJ11_28280 [Paraburkholderia sp.]|uniref:hypothetical protein n=1 Tax=Paraburkholderia sp. TaxID=1926495 RepID=UPI002CF9B955|nr:hypothetical protein [Paraburkholderia sp.]HTR10490.1 hypothetical protein [Paraburkholderia sp.]